MLQTVLHQEQQQYQQKKLQQQEKTFAYHKLSHTHRTKMGRAVQEDLQVCNWLLLSILILLCKASHKLFGCNLKLQADIIVSFVACL